MGKINKVHCLFEQSGTFKNKFKEFEIQAIDYDIENQFNQTDVIIDIFNEIEVCYNGGASIFNDFNEEDIIMAFFPCTRFENQIALWFRGDSVSQKKWSLSEKLAIVSG